MTLLLRSNGSGRPRSAEMNSEFLDSVGRRSPAAAACEGPQERTSRERFPASLNDVRWMTAA